MITKQKDPLPVSAVVVGVVSGRVIAGACARAVGRLGAGGVGRGGGGGSRAHGGGSRAHGGANRRHGQVLGLDDGLANLWPLEWSRLEQRWVIAILKKNNYQLHYQLLLC